MGRKIIVTGANGFIGKELCNKLRHLGYEILALSSGDGDIADPKTISAISPVNVTHVFHLAGRTFVPESWNDPYEFLRTNVMGLTAVLNYCLQNSLSATYVSAYVYGNDVTNPISENTIPAPNNPYALSKRLAEEVCEFYAKHLKLPVNIIRPFNVYGRGQGEHFLIPYLIKQIREGTQIIVKDLSPRRDYIHVSDLIDCLVCAMNYREYGVFNAGSGKSYSVEEIINLLLQVNDKDLPIQSTQTVRMNEISDTVADISLAKEKLKWRPKIGIEQGLKMM